MKSLTLVMAAVLSFSGIGLARVSAVDGPLANATVSFGLWRSDFDSPLDRITGDPAMGAGNADLMVPQTVTIKQGGAVNFIIGGGHVLAIYDDGHRPEDVDLGPIELASVCATSAGGVLSDSEGRVYRGPCFTGRRDGVEVVQFAKPGTYLVICARKNHFFNPNTGEFEMFGYVKVLPGK